MQLSKLQSALAYAERGFSVIPVQPNKRPYIKWEDYQSRHATTSEISEWWQKWPAAMIGICTGEISGVFVIDCDNDEAYQTIQSILPDGFLTAIAKTPRGYHIYLVYPKDQPISNATAIMPGVDVRGNGGYIIAPPSVNAEGKVYEWLPGLSITEIAPAAMPNAVLKGTAINNNVQNKYTHTERYTSAQNMFSYGRRDDDLFRTANVLTKGGMPPEEIAQILERLILSWGEKPDQKWISDKIASAKKRSDRRSGDVTKTIEEWVSVTDGYFSVTECHKALQSVTHSEQVTFRGILRRLAQRGVIEKHGNKDGVYRRINQDEEIIDWKNADISPLPIKFPLGVHEYVQVHRGNVLVIAGESNAGKTAYCLNMALMNRDVLPVKYMSSEMQDGAELKIRIMEFTQLLDLWDKVQFTFQTDNFPDKINPDGINIVDYLDEGNDSEAYKMPMRIRLIADKLKSGIAIVAIQKDPAKQFGFGGAGTKNRARVYLTISPGKLCIEKAKIWRDKNDNPNGKFVNFKLAAGCRFSKASEWSNG